VETWCNSTVDYPERTNKRGAIGASNEDQIDAGPSSKRVRCDSQPGDQASKCVRSNSKSASPSVTPVATETHGHSTDIGGGVVELTRDPDDDVPLSDILRPEALRQSGRKGSTASPIPRVDTRQDSENVLASSENVPADEPSAPSQPRPAATASSHSSNADLTAKFKALGVQRDRLRNLSDSLVPPLLQEFDSLNLSKSRIYLRPSSTSSLSQPMN